ncbi:MAG: hypothetical protein QXM96_00230 [Candidatus Woesearchaeota archaeon]
MEKYLTPLAINNPNMELIDGDIFDNFLKETDSDYFIGKFLEKREDRRKERLQRKDKRREDRMKLKEKRIAVRQTKSDAKLEEAKSLTKDAEQTGKLYESLKPQDDKKEDGNNFKKFIPLIIGGLLLLTALFFLKKK